MAERAHTVKNRSAGSLCFYFLCAVVCIVCMYVCMYVIRAWPQPLEPGHCREQSEQQQ